MNSNLTLKILGSVSPFPTKDDNCVGYLINHNNIKIMLDCGIGSSKELKIPEDLDNLHVFISHFHKDHYSDLSALAYASYVYHNLKLLKNKVKVYIPRSVSTNEEYLDYILIKNMKEQYFEIIEYDENSSFDIYGLNISFMKNYHSIPTYSVKINYNKFNFVYTSDIGYKSKEDIIKFTKEADYLLIESSLLKKDNISNEYHLHASESAEIGKKANAKKVILTHFWPSQKTHEYLLEAKKVYENVDVAKTGDIIKL